MKQFISFVRKEFYHIFRDARTTMILLLMPVILIILFGYAITTEIKRVPIAIFDQSRDDTEDGRPLECQRVFRAVYDRR